MELGTADVGGDE